MILNEVLAATNHLREQWGVTVQVWSVTSFSELERDARSALHACLAGTQTTQGHVEQCLGGAARSWRRRTMSVRRSRCWARMVSAVQTRSPKPVVSWTVRIIAMLDRRG
ncbi:transketolase-like TK C-terminal-containing protein [Pseudomonas veronii]|uniref:transketolase-like TK C-terminal-containing protein n=1 Tax=Pseudomonas veronii TaxID=76761 RepID=UPI0035E3C0CA